MEWSFKMDRQMIEGMLGDALEREIITAKIVDGAYPPAVEVGILDGLGREIDFGDRLWAWRKPVDGNSP